MGNITKIFSEQYSCPALGGAPFPQPVGSAAMPFTAEFDMVVGWNFAQDGNVKIKINDLDTDSGYTCSIDRDAGSWISDGFTVQTNCRVMVGEPDTAYWEEWLTWMGTNAIDAFTCSVISVSEKTISLNIDFDPFENVSKGVYFSSIGQFYNGDNDYVFKFYGIPSASYCRFKHCFFKGGSAQPNFLDFYNSPIYYAGELSSVHAQLSPMGQDLVFSSAMVYAQDVTGEYIPSLDARAMREMYVRFTIQDNIPWYSADISNALDSGTTPAMYSGSNTPVIAIEATVQNTSGSPATAKTAKLTSQKGLIGWYNEGGNGVPMPADLITNFEILQDTTVTDKVRRIGTTYVNFRVNSTVLEPIYFTAFADNYQLSPDSIDAKTKQVFGQAGMSSGGTIIIDNGIIQSATAEYYPTYVDVNVVLSVTPEQAQNIGSKVCLCASAPFVYNGEATAATKILARAELGGAADVEGLILSSSVVYTPNIFNGTYTAGSTNIEDSTVYQFQANLAPTAVLQSATLQWIAINQQGKEQVLTSKDVRFTANANGSVTSNSQDYSLNIAFGSTILNATWNTNVPWRGWLPAFGGNIDNINEPTFAQNGLCQDAGVYFENNCTIHACLILVLYGEGSGQSDGVTGIGEYRLQSAPVRSVRYDENENWSTVITCKNENGYVLPTGLISSSGKTTVESVNTWIGIGGIEDEVQCVLRIEPGGSVSGGFDEVGNVVEKQAGSKWVGDYATLSIVGNIATCTAVLNSGTTGDVKISSKIASKSSVPLGAKITEDGIFKFTEDENFKVIE
ncbi:MAG: hypothetical protein IPL70_09325 [Uliginosibacterium sp.]|nr:hypothetical protein [Uliginosibacterium sp.]